MAHRMSSKAYKGRFFFMCLAVFVIMSMSYFYWSNTEENYKHSKWAEKRCLLELSSVKYQLDVATEYKAHVEIMLNNCQKDHKADKNTFKEVAENCVTMKQQWSLCQNQFDDLQNECKKVREHFNKAQSEIDILKSNLQEELKKKNEAQKIIDKLFHEIYDLKKKNQMLAKSQKQVLNQNAPTFTSKNADFIKSTHGLNFSQQVEISSGDYQVVVSNLTSSTAKSKNELPPGFAPVLSVVENPENVRQKPPPVNNTLVLEKVKNKKYNEKNVEDKDLEIIENVPDVKIDKIGDHELVDVPVENDKEVMRNNLNHAEEDDDEGEEYAIN